MLFEGDNDPTPESIWVAMDEENKVMYLLNHSIAMFPYPSWGMELPLGKRVDINKHRNEDPNKTTIIVCKEAYKALEKYLKKCGGFDFEKFREEQLERAVGVECNCENNEENEQS